MMRWNCAETPSDDEAFVIGGAELYREALPRADRLYSHGPAEVSGTPISRINWDEWDLWNLSDHDADA